MKNFLVSPLLLAFLFSTVLGDYGVIEELLKRTSYDKRIAPEGNEGPGSPVTVAISTYIIDIHKMDDSSMDFTAVLYFRQHWNDSRLQYKEDVDPVILRDVENVWTPDLFFIQERQGSLHQIIHPNIFCQIKPNGDVRFSSRVSVTLSCPMDLRNFPHDVQECKVSVESYGFQKKHINLEWFKGTSSPLMFNENITMLEFELIGATPSSETVSLSSGNYSCLHMNLTFKRKIGFFTIKIYVPFVILVLMASLSLWIKADERWLRLSLLLVILYLMVTISTSVNSMIPPAPYTKASDVWIGFCQSLVFAAFLEFIAVALIAARESDEDSSRSKGEILLSLDPEAKDHKLSTDSLKSPLSKMINMFDARKGGAQNTLSLRVDKICRLLFPIIFVIFNIIYWSVYCSAYIP